MMLGAKVCVVLSAVVYGLDPRDLKSGDIIGNMSSGYSDQPNCLVRRDGAWLCTVTFNDKPEGSSGERVVTTISTDKGKTWSERYDVEPGQALQHAYSTLFQGPGESIYVTYVENSDNVTTLNGGFAAREDMYGHFWLRRSTDGGKTWGGPGDRWEIPVRLTSIDYENSWKGQVQIMWAVDKGFVCPKHGTFLSFAKVGTYVVDPPTSAWLLHSPNLHTAGDPADVTWTVLPEGDEGIRDWDKAAPGISEEGHVVPMKNGSLYYVFRTDSGLLGGRVSHDGGKTFVDPSGVGAAEYETGKALKNPRGPITPRAVDSLGGSSEYLLLFYNNGNRDFNGRNPYWVAPGWQDDAKGTIVWGQPEVALYSETAADRIGYPDFTIDVESKALYISETEKVHCRMHKLGDDLLHGLLNQRDANAKATATLDVGRVAAGASAAETAPSFAKGFALAVWLDGPLGADGPSVLVSTLSRAPATGGGYLQSGVRLARGLVQDALQLEVGRLSAAHLNIPWVWTVDAECSTALDAAGPHHLVVSADPYSRVVSAMVDGRLCDGGDDQVQGWIALPDAFGDVMTYVDGDAHLTVGPAKTNVLDVAVYDRYLRTTEMLGNFRAGHS